MTVNLLQIDSELLKNILIIYNASFMYNNKIYTFQISHATKITERYIKK